MEVTSIWPIPLSLLIKEWWASFVFPAEMTKNLFHNTNDKLKRRRRQVWSHTSYTQWAIICIMYFVFSLLDALIILDFWPRDQSVSPTPQYPLVASGVTDWSLEHPEWGLSNGFHRDCQQSLYYRWSHIQFTRSQGLATIVTSFLSGNTKCTIL